MTERASGEGSVFPSDILVVDDNPATLQLLVDILGTCGYSIRSASNGRLALQAVHERPPALILLDISMPDMNGYEVCKALKEDEKLSVIPVIFLSGRYDTIDKVRAFGIGGVDYVTKPFQIGELKARIENHLKIRELQTQLEQYNRRLEQRVREQVREIYESQMATIFALAKLAESRHQDTGEHIERTRAFCRLLAVQLGKIAPFSAIIDHTFIENIFYASPLHDIGKVGIPDCTLLKPGRYTEAEFEEMKRHTVIGAETLEAVRQQYPHNSFVAMGIEIARSHHEKWDGSGYPDGKAGEEIPLSARIMALADVYDALRSTRAYKEAYRHDESSEMIIAQAGRHFDPRIVSAFQQVESLFGKISDSTGDQPEEE